jgi:glycosyltransferase involved in cell wall biosynthesis
MRILCVTSNFEHPAMGGSTRYYHFVKALSERHDVTLLARARGPVPSAARDEMAGYAEQMLTFECTRERMGPRVVRVDRALGFSRRLQRAWRRRSTFKEMGACVGRLLSSQRYDLVVLRGENVVPIAAECRGVPLLIDISDAHSVRLRQALRYARWADLPARGWQYAQVRRRERRVARADAHVAFLARRDRDAMLPNSSRAWLIPNGVDLDYWTRTGAAPASNRIVFPGVMGYAPNADGAMFLLDRIVPLVRRSLPDVEVAIVGREPPPALVAAARRHPRVTVTGYVADVRPHLQRASVVAAPLRFASGLQNKVLEALAMRVPVVTTSIVAAGLCDEERQDPPIAVADRPAEFAQRLVELMADPEGSARRAAAGRTYVERYFSWPQSAALLEEACLAAVSGRPRPC